MKMHLLQMTEQKIKDKSVLEASDKM